MKATAFIGLVLSGILLVVLGGSVVPAWGQDPCPPESAATASQPAPAKVVAARPVARSEVDLDLRALPPVSGPAIRWDILDCQRRERESAAERPLPGYGHADSSAPPRESAPMPSPTQSFAGLGFSDPCPGGGCGIGWQFHPDTAGDVGPNHYVQAANTAVPSFAVFSKTGSQLAATTFDSLWAGAKTGTPCDDQNMGNPVVIYDPMGDRWFVTDFAFDLGSDYYPVAPCYECIAVSKTPDPVSGGWYLYAVDQSSPPGASTLLLNDYPKFGIWPDALYQTANMYTTPGAGAFWGVGVWAYNRLDLEAGLASPRVVAASIPYDAEKNPGTFTVLPANLRIGPQGAFPPASSPAYLVNQTEGGFSFQVRTFSVDWGTLSGTLSALTTVSEISSWGSPVSVPQPGTTTKLDSQGYQAMMQAQYRNIGGTESIWLNHTGMTYVGADPPVPTDGIVWAQLDVTGGTIATGPVQQQLYMPETTLQRWMGSLAVDHSGNMALGYSCGNGADTNYASILYSGRLSTDPLNQLPQTETTLKSGNGYYQHTYQNWGQYSSMSVDPTDDCTFWYTNEYMESSGTDWHTWIGSFKFSECADLAPGKLSVTVRDCSGSAVEGAIVIIDGHDYGVTLSDGTFGAILTPGAHTVAVSHGGATYLTLSPTIATGTTTAVAYTLGTLSPTITPTPSTTCSAKEGNQASGPAGMTTYDWTIDNGTITSTSNIQTITYTAGAAGSVTLTLTVTSGSACGTGTSSITIAATPTETAGGSGTASSLQWADSSQLQWPVNGTASTYALYRGEGADLPKVLTGAANSCTRYTGATTNATGLSENPSPGSFWWFVVAGLNSGCEGPAGYATGGTPEIINSTGACP